MQDWVTDDPMQFLRSMKTATQTHAEEFMTCTTCEQQPWFSFFFDGTGNNREIDEPKQKLSNILPGCTWDMMKRDHLFGDFTIPASASQLNDATQTLFRNKSAWVLTFRDDEGYECIGKECTEAGPTTTCHLSPLEASIEAVYLGKYYRRHRVNFAWELGRRKPSP